MKWVDLSIAIAGALTFATFLTLIVTPAMLVLGDRAGKFWGARGFCRRSVCEGNPKPLMGADRFTASRDHACFARRVRKRRAGFGA